MTKLQSRMYDRINAEIDNILAEVAYEVISSGAEDKELEALNDKLMKDLKVALTQILKEV